MENLRAKLGKREAKLENLMTKLEKLRSKLESRNSKHLNEGCHQQKRILATAKISNKDIEL